MCLVFHTCLLYLLLFKTHSGIYFCLEWFSNIIVCVTNAVAYTMKHICQRIPMTGNWCHMLSLSMCLVALHGNYTTIPSHQFQLVIGSVFCLCLCGPVCAWMNPHFLFLERRILWPCSIFLKVCCRYTLMTHLLCWHTLLFRALQSGVQGLYSNDRYVEVRCNIRHQSLV